MLPTTPDDDRLLVRERLRALGYAARCVNVSCYDVEDAQRRLHYLSGEEGRALAAAPLPHPVDLLDFATDRGRNLWYTFPSAGRGPAPVPENL